MKFSQTIMGGHLENTFWGVKCGRALTNDQLVSLLVGGRVVEHGGHQVDGDGEHYRGVVLRCNAAQGLEVPQLMKTKVISYIGDCK